MRGMVGRRRLWAGIILVVVVLGVASLAIPGVRRPVLRTAGWALVVNDGVEPADVIVVSVDADGAGALEAADLVSGGVAARVAVFGETPDAVVEGEFMRRGVPYENAAARTVREAKALGVGTVELVPTYVAGSEDEASALAGWCDQHRFRSIVVVTNADHSRRVRRMIHRSMKGHPTRVATRSARYSAFDPDQWWRTRRGIRSEAVELQKLLFDIVRHPIS